MVKFVHFLLGLFCLISLSLAQAQQAAQAPLHSVHYQPGQGWDSWWLQLGYWVNDFDLEEETQDVDLDDIDWKYFHVTMGWMYGLRPNIMWFGSISHVDFGDRSRTYADDTDLPAMNESFKGLEYVELGIQKRYTQFLDNNIDQSLQFKIRSQPFRAKDHNASMGGTNLSSHYHYTFYQNWGEINGSLDAIYYGTKKLRRIDGELQKTKRYSEFGFTVGAKKTWTKFYMGFLSGFGLTTDYIVSSPSYNRSADNGFNYHGKIFLGWDAETFLVELATMRRSDVFNKSREGFDGDIDYELESEHTTLRFLWPF